jgi:hypothetical protein
MWRMVLQACYHVIGIICQTLPRPTVYTHNLATSCDAGQLKKRGSAMWKNDVAGITCRAQPRPTVYMLARLCAASP